MMFRENHLKYIEKVQISTGKIHVFLRLRTASIKSTVGNKTRIFPSPFHVSTSSRLTLAGAFCSATGETESGGYVTVPCPSKLKQRKSTADWLQV